MLDPTPARRRVRWPPPRLLVSDGGLAHLPTCHTVPESLRSGAWGEIVDVNDAIEALMAGDPVRSRAVGQDAPGPIATRLCHRCLNGF